ncbi:hypothetical protein [Amycolatopsis sp. TNS106]|uniref:hypothetical protein n=1 Tax=Amycolatopsis sp. TNS106 TaxID=2861750 RepID=UPI001C587134|nr:hypothetical protein [Amycolatopsis sp. TNS106]
MGMSILTRIGFIETEKQEQARLAQAPVGSTSHYLSTLPITITEWPQDLIVQLPWDPPRTPRSYTVVVVPLTFQPDPVPVDLDEEPLPRKLNPGSWGCAVVASDHPRFPVGGHRIVVGADEIARGTKVSIQSPRPEHRTAADASPS